MGCALTCSHVVQGHGIFAYNLCSSELLKFVLHTLLNPFLFSPLDFHLCEYVTPLPFFISSLPVTFELISKRLRATGLRFFSCQDLFLGNSAFQLEKVAFA